MIPTKWIAWGAAMACLMAGCAGNSNKNAGNSIFGVAIPDTFESGEITDIFKTCKVIPLETNDSSLTGAMNTKILKRDGTIYVCSVNEIIKFNQDGKYIGKLSKAGSGPEEYSRIIDFDIVEGTDGNEIWISYDKGVNRYSAADAKYLGGIETPTYVNNFRYINDSTILAVTPDEKTIKILTTEGKIRQEFLDNDFPNSLCKQIQFRKNGDTVFCQIENTNDAVVYDIANDSIHFAAIANCGEIGDGAHIVTQDDNRSAYKSQGMKGQYKYVTENYVRLIAAALHGDEGIMVTLYPDGNKVLSVTNGTGITNFRFGENPTLENSLIADAEPDYPITLLACDSDEGFMFIVDNQTDDTDSNPTLLEVSGIR